MKKNEETNHITVLITSTTPYASASPLEYMFQRALFTVWVMARSSVPPSPPRMWQKASVFVE